MQETSMLANVLRTTAVAALLTLGATTASTTSAAADTYKTSCYGDDCVWLQCDDWGRDCIRLGYFDRNVPPAVTPDEYTETYREYPDSYYGPPPDSDDEYNDGNPYYHYYNRFDPDNDYDDYPG
jgi:hypothetical protein